MRNRLNTTLRRIGNTLLCSLASLTLVVSTVHAVPGAKTPAAADKTPAAFKGWKPKMSDAELNRVKAYVEGEQKKGKLKRPRFKKGTPKARRTRIVGQLDRTLKRIKADPKTTGEVKSSITVWESLNAAQKETLLAEPDAVVAAVPAVALAVAVAGLAVGVYNVYKGQQRENERDREKGGGDDKGPSKDEPAEVLDALDY